MSDETTIGIRLTADGSAMVGATKAAREEVDRLNQSASKLNSTLAAQGAQFAKATTTKDYAASLRALDDELASFVATANPAYRAQMQLDQGQELLSRGLKAGLISQATYNETLAILSTRYKNAAEAAGSITSATDKATFSTAQARREIVVIGHEILTGNFSRIPGSLAVLASRANLSAAALIGIAGAGILAAGGIGAVSVAAIIGANEQRKFNDMLVLTGNAAGLTAGSYQRMAQQIAVEANVSIGTAREALLALAGSGEFSGEVLQKTGRVVSEFARLSGQNADAVAKDFASMSDGVARWAAKHNEQYHFITAAQYEHIAALEEEGRKQEAMGATMDAFDAHLKKQTTNIGFLAAAWNSVTHAAAGAWDALKNLGKDASLEDQNAASNKKITFLMNRLDVIPKSSGEYAFIQNEIAKEKQAIDARMTQIAVSSIKAKAQAEDDANQAAAIKALQSSKARIESYRTNAEKERAEIAKYDADQAALAKGGMPLDSAAQRASMLAKIHEQYKDKTARPRGDGGVSNALNSQGADNARLQDEIDQILAYGKALDQAKEAAMRFETERGKFKDQSPKVKASLIAGAQEQDFLAADKKQLEEQNREAQARKAAQDAAILAADKWRESLAKSNEQRYLEISLIGKTVSEQRVILDQARIDIELKEKNKNVTAEVADANSKAAEAAKQSIAASMAASRTFDAGMKSTLAAYRDEVGNTAAQTARVINDGFAKAEDALVNFAKTGKLNFKDFADSVITDLLRIQAQKTVAGIAGMIGSSFGSYSSSGSGFGDWYGAASGSSYGTDYMSSQSLMLASQWHTGGVPATDTSVARSVHPSLFANAPRFHTGIGAGERPAIIRNDEAVLTPGQMRMLSPAGVGGGITVNQSINVTMQSSGNEQTDSNKLAASLKDPMRQLITETLIKEKRPGGMLA